MSTVCEDPDDTEYFLFHRDAYKEEQDCLEKSVEEVLYLEKESLQSVTTI